MILPLVRTLLGTAMLTLVMSVAGLSSTSHKPASKQMSWPKKIQTGSKSANQHGGYNGDAHDHGSDPEQFGSH